jgi:hypothetical protein
LETRNFIEPKLYVIIGECLNIGMYWKNILLLYETTEPFVNNFVWNVLWNVLYHMFVSSRNPRWPSSVGKVFKKFPMKPEA